MHVLIIRVIGRLAFIRITFEVQQELHCIMFSMQLIAFTSFPIVQIQIYVY